MSSAVAATWGIAALATGGVIFRPWQLPEAVWAVAGAGLLLAAGLLSPADAWVGAANGWDVYLFLAGMMLLAEVARQEGLFDWLAAKAATLASGSATRLFLLIYAVGTVVTVFLSNDATAVVLTPAVAAVVRAAEAERPLPFLLVCAFIANAASFVLPISNPANLVIYGSHLPPLLQWLPRYALPSAVSILATYAVLRWTQRDALDQTLAASVTPTVLTTGGRLAACGIGLAAASLLTASALDVQLGLPTCAAGLATMLAISLVTRRSPLATLGGVSWGVLPLVAGLFVLVEALDRTGLIRLVAAALGRTVQASPTLAVWAAGLLPAVLCNALNNLPAGLIAGSAVQLSDPPATVTSAVLIGIDLGPNLSVTGSLATILWLTALRREGLEVGAGAFLRIGVLVMPPALLLSVLALILQG